MNAPTLIAEFYDDEYASLGMLEQDVPFVLERLGGARRRVLVGACGTGREAIPAAQAGHLVSGVDVDPDMIRIACSKRELCGLSERSLRFHQQSLLELDLPGSERFDAAWLLFNSFLVFTRIEQQDRVLRSLASMLKRGAELIIDVFQPDTAQLSEGIERDIDPHFFFSRSLATGVMRTTTTRPTGRLLERRTTYRYQWCDARGRVRSKSTTFTHTWFTPRELVLLMERCGFVDVELLGDYDGGVLTPQSTRMIAIGRRGAGRS